MLSPQSPRHGPAATQGPATTHGPAATTHGPPATHGPAATTHSPATTHGPAATMHGPATTHSPAATHGREPLGAAQRGRCWGCAAGLFFHAHTTERMERTRGIRRSPLCVLFFWLFLCSCLSNCSLNIMKLPKTRVCLSLSWPGVGPASCTAVLRHHEGAEAPSHAPLLNERNDKWFPCTFSCFQFTLT